MIKFFIISTFVFFFGFTKIEASNRISDISCSATALRLVELLQGERVQLYPLRPLRSLQIRLDSLKLSHKPISIYEDSLKAMYFEYITLILATANDLSRTYREGNVSAEDAILGFQLILKSYKEIELQYSLNAYFTLPGPERIEISHQTDEYLTRFIEAIQKD